MAKESPQGSFSGQQFRIHFISLLGLIVPIQRLGFGDMSCVRSKYLLSQSSEGRIFESKPWKSNRRFTRHSFLALHLGTNEKLRKGTVFSVTKHVG